jgi:lipoprotein signal peptidase
MIGLITAALVVSLDQLTKQIALSALMPGDALPIGPFLNMRLGFNEGVAFGMFADWFSGRPTTLAALTFGLILALGVWLWRTRQWSYALGLGALMGGGLSNVIDRLRIGAVVDFIDFHAWGYHWPAFNLADAAIVCGVAVLLIGDFVSRRDDRIKQQDLSASG